MSVFIRLEDEMLREFKFLAVTNSLSMEDKTQFDILLQETYFDSCHYWDAPGSFRQLN